MLKNVTKQLLSPIGLHSMKKKYRGSQWARFHSAEFGMDKHHSHDFLS